MIFVSHNCNCFIVS